MSKSAIRRTTHSMTVALLARRNLSVGDVSVIELSDSSDLRPNPATIAPSMLDLKYVSISADKEVDSQQVNREGSQEIDRKPHLTEEAQVNLKKDQTDPNPHAQLISSPQTDLKEAQVIQTFTLEEIKALKAELITWVEKWDVLRGKKLKCKRMMKMFLLKNKKLQRQNRINRSMAVRFRTKLNEARRSVPIKFSVESALKTRYFVFGDL